MFEIEEPQMNRCQKCADPCNPKRGYLFLEYTSIPPERMAAEPKGSYLGLCKQCEHEFNEWLNGDPRGNWMD